MKKVVVFVSALTLAAGLFAQGVTIKKGTAKMTEAYYLELKQKADAYEKMQQELANTKAALASATESQKVKLNSFEDSVSYAIGQDIANSWNQQDLGVNVRVAGMAMLDMASGTFNMPQRTCRDLLTRFQSNFERKQQAKQQEMMAGAKDNIEAGKKFLEANKNSKAVYTTPSGLQYKIIKKGNGKRPSATSTVSVHYTGTLIDGTKFDSSLDRGTPLQFPLNQVIIGWQEGLQLMDEGSKYILYIPYNLGYGESPVGSIPPGSTLIFEVELLEIVK